MGTQALADRIAASYRRTKVAAAFPFEKEEAQQSPPPGGAPGKRAIPTNHDFDPRALKPMAKALWASSVSLGHALTAYRFVNRLKSTTISPDGMLGGRGYVMAVKDVRKALFDTCEALSTITDTLYDEIQAPHWKAKLAQLDDNDQEDVSRFVEESQNLLDNPGEEAEEEIEKIDKENDPQASEMPGSGKAEESVATPPRPKTAATLEANSSVDPDTLSGPRVDNLDRGDQLGPWGSFNVGERPSDDWTEGEREYAYRSEWENDFRKAQSALPKDDDTPTEAWDFGLGYGARGQGAGGYANPSGEGNGTKGVWGPHSGLPGSANVSVNDTTPIVDVTLNERRASWLPGDGTEPAARSDYYKGWKGNLVQSESGLPGSPPVTLENAPPMVNTDYVTEDADTAYVRYDYTTHTLREDPLHQSAPKWPSEG